MSSDYLNPIFPRFHSKIRDYNTLAYYKIVTIEQGGNNYKKEEDLDKEKLEEVF